MYTDSTSRKSSGIYPLKKFGYREKGQMTPVNISLVCQRLELIQRYDED